MLPFAVLSSMVLLASGQQVKSFYRGPDASYSSEYTPHSAEVEYAPARRQQSPPAAYANRGVPQRHFEPQQRAGLAAVPELSAQLDFPSSRSHAAFQPVQYSTDSHSFPRTHLKPVSGNIAVPAYPVSVGLRVAGSRGAALEQRTNYSPTPYAFEYSAHDGEGGHSRQERGDGNGRVTGSYTIQLADGRSRVVEYIADEGGYRANIKTNEFGTESQSPADVGLQSSAIPAKEATLLAAGEYRQFGSSSYRKA